MRINNIVFCENTQQATLPDGKSITVLMNPTPELNPPYIPGLFSFSVSFGISEIGESSQLTASVKLFDPQNELVTFIEISENNIPAGYKNLTINCDMRNVKVLEEGIYRLHIEVLGEMKDESVMIRRQ